MNVGRAPFAGNRVCHVRTAGMRGNDLKALQPPTCWTCAGFPGVASIRTPWLPTISGVEMRWSYNAECNAPPTRRCDACSL